MEHKRAFRHEYVWKPKLDWLTRHTFSRARHGILLFIIWGTGQSMNSLPYLGLYRKFWPILAFSTPVSFDKARLVTLRSLSNDKSSFNFSWLHLRQFSGKSAKCSWIQCSVLVWKLLEIIGVNWFVVWPMQLVMQVNKIQNVNENAKYGPSVINLSFLAKHKFAHVQFI